MQALSRISIFLYKHFSIFFNFLSVEVILDTLTTTHLLILTVRTFLACRSGEVMEKRSTGWEREGSKIKGKCVWGGGWRKRSL